MTAKPINNSAKGKLPDQIVEDGSFNVRELDISAAQIVRWLRAEASNGNGDIHFRASREFVSEDVQDFTEYGLEQGDVSDPEQTVGILEVSPKDASHGWRLEVRIEDALGMHVPDDHSAPDIPEEIDLDAFEAHFTKSDDGPGHAKVFYTRANGEENFEWIMTRMVRDSH